MVRFELTISIKVDNGIRHGTFEIAGIKGEFPVQAVTSTNLNHAIRTKFAPFNFKTSIAESVEFELQKLVDDLQYRERRRKKIAKMIREHPEYLFLFTGNSIKGSTFKFTRENNRALVDFQMTCGFKLIKVFFNRVRGIMDDYEYFRRLVPDRRFVATVDENVNPIHFSSIYEDSIRRGDELISFFGRRPRITSSKKITSAHLNLIFLENREGDKILRLSSGTPKSINGVVSSVAYCLSGIDTFAFATRRGSPNVAEYKLMALDEFYYMQLLSNTKLVCVITGKNLYESSRQFQRKYKSSSIPVSTHDIVRLNEKLRHLHELRPEQLESIISKRR